MDKPGPFSSSDKSRRKQNNNKHSSDEKDLADVAVEDGEETAGEAHLEKIPYDIQEVIIKNLPIKSLLRFRSVSKQWKSLIDSSKFIEEYNTHKKHIHHLFVSYKEFGYCDREYFSIPYSCMVMIDDDTSLNTSFHLMSPRLLNYFTYQK